MPSGDSPKCAAWPTFSCSISSNPSITFPARLRRGTARQNRPRVFKQSFAGSHRRPGSDARVGRSLRKGRRYTGRSACGKCRRYSRSRAELSAIHRVAPVSTRCGFRRRQRTPGVRPGPLEARRRPAANPAARRCIAECARGSFSGRRNGAGSRGRGRRHPGALGGIHGYRPLASATQ